MRSIATVISFFVVAALYFLYGWVLVPAVLPNKQLNRSAFVSAAAENTESAQREAVEPFLPVLPENGWESDVKHELHFLQFDTVVVLFGHDQIDAQNKRLLKLEPCTVLILPDTADHLSEESLRVWQRQTIVLRTQQYAEIEFDSEFDVTKLPLPKVAAGRLYGKVSISSGMKDEGPQDDLTLEAENVAVTETAAVTKIETLKDVRFQLGYHSGEGTNLSLELTAKETPHDKITKNASKELSSVIFQRLKTLHLVFPEDEKLPCRMSGGVPVPGGAATELDVRCQRQFGFVWNNSEKNWQASFNGSVDITRKNPDKTLDRLTAEEVILTLQEKAETKPAYGNFGAMEPVKFAARGKKGVQPPQPARFALKQGSDVQLIGDEIFIDLQKKMLKLSTFEQKTGGSKEIEMILNSLYSIKSDNTVEYTLGENGAFGSFKSIGKGSMTGITGTGTSAKKVRLDWNEMAMAPHPLVKDQLVVKLGKGIRGVMDGFGTLTAEEIEICCNTEANSSSSPQKKSGIASSGAPSGIVPDHIIVKNNVRFANESGTCDVKRLDIYFTNVSQDGKVTQSRWTPQAMLLPPPKWNAAAGQPIEFVQYQQPAGGLQPLPIYQAAPAEAAKPAAIASPVIPAVSRSAPLQRGVITQNTPLGSQNLLGLQSKQGARFSMSGNLMKMQVRNQNGQATAEIIALEGSVKAVETAAPQDSAAAFNLQGDTATVWEPGGLNTAVKITCQANSPNAFIKGRGVELWSKELNLTRADNNCWSPFPGRLVADTAAVDASALSGTGVKAAPPSALSAAASSRLIVEWNKNMQFDGKVMRFFGQTDKTGNRVRVLYQTQSLWCDTMEIYLNRQVRFFDDTSNVPPKAEMIQCAKNVFVRSLDRDADGKQKSVATAEAELLRYYIDRNYLVAEGPGRLSTTFAGKASSMQNVTNTVRTTSAADNSLNHLSVWFQDTLQGVLLGSGKNIDLNGRVEVAYFPAAGWDDTIAHENFAAARKTGCTLECEKMKIAELQNPADTTQTTMELTAEDDAVIDGYGVFGKAQLIKYNQLKNTVRFEKSVKVKTNRPGQNGDYAAESVEYNIVTGSVNNVGMQGLTITN
ncbi:MAG: hypothetical protein LBT89_11510 [Planctomycetaceae bacterium]|jgi:hypothetical protein|nr:hypothetical protein [Planctomycetaceae bacterium]